MAGAGKEGEKRQCAKNVFHRSKIRRNAGKSPVNRGGQFVFGWVGGFGMKKVMSGKKAKAEDVATIFQKSCSIYETLTENLTAEEKLGLGRSRSGIDIVICGDG
jgi:hypothetical protein